MQMDSRHLNNRTGTGRAMITLIFGVLILAIGAWGSYIYGSNALHVAQSLGDAATPFTTPAIILSGLWLIAAIMLAIAGLSLVISALMRRPRNLIPGPTLYLLGLAVVGIGIYFLVFHQWIPGVIASVVGVVVCYWEYAFDVS